MKKQFVLALSAVCVLLVSCTKEAAITTPSTNNTQKTPVSTDKVGNLESKKVIIQGEQSFSSEK